jgi:hypothetical protein
VTGSAGMTSRDVAEVLDLSELDGAAIDLLEDAVESGDVRVGSLTDEEVHWLRPNADAAPDAHLDAPRLGALADHEQRAALDAVMVLLAVRGDAEVSPDGEVRWHGRHALLAAMRYGAEAAASLRVDRHDHRPELRAAIYRITGGLFLTEEVDEPTGVHHFVLRAPDRQASWTAWVSDPTGCAGVTSEPEHTTEPGAWGSRLDALARRARTTALLQVASVPELDEPPRTLTMLGCDDGLWVLQGYEADAGGEAALQRLDPGDLAGLCLAVLTGGQAGAVVD